MGEWAWAAGICPLIGPWRYGAVQAVYQREGGFDPHKQLDFLSRHGVTNVFGTPTAIRSMMSIADAGSRYPQLLPDRVLGRRAAEPGGDPLVPRAVRRHGARLLRPDGVLPAVRELPVHGGPGGLDGKAAARLGCAILDEDERPVAAGERGEICLRARTNPHYPLGYWNRPEDSAEVFGGEWFHTKDAARRTPTATSGTRAEPTT
jgi:acetyl-CoA synthetase